jgi:hypothetical protein
VAIQESWAIDISGCGFFSFSVSPSSAALIAASAGRSASFATVRMLCKVQPWRASTSCITRTAASNATTATLSRLLAMVICEHAIPN